MKRSGVRLLLRWAINALALWAAVQLVPGVTHTGSNTSLLVVALIFGLVNALVRPLLLFLTCPLIVLTLGLFVLIVNALLFSMTDWISSLFGLGFDVAGFWPTLVGSLVVSVVSGVLTLLLKDEFESERGRRAGK